MSRESVAADRRAIPRSVLVALAATTGLTVGIGAHLVPSTVDSPLPQGPAGFAAGVLAILLLRSLSVRRVAMAMCLVAVVLAVRLGQLPVGTSAEAGMSMAWVTSATATLVLAASIRPTPLRRPRHVAAVRATVAIASVASAVALTFGATAGLATSDGTSPGASPQFGPGTLGSPLYRSDSLDMTNRPRLSDALVMTVQTERPGFFRAQTFDTWDGTTWRQEPGASTTVDSDGRLTPRPDDLAGKEGELRRDLFRIEAPLAATLPLGPSAVRIDAPGPVAQGVDGALFPYRPLGRGATYTVDSRSFDLTPASVRAAGSGDVPADVASRWARPPVASERTRELVRELTGDLENSYDKVQAIERWLGANTEYSFDAPLSPGGVDVVDHFLFTSRLGWCEQVASSLTVMLRLSGVPARLATGFVPAGRDRVSGAYRVLESGAHAWTEVWFDGLGWVPFDPTANIPLGSYTPPASPVGDLLVSVGVWVFLSIGALAALGPLAWSWLGALWRRLRRGRAPGQAGRGAIVGGPSSWAIETERRLVAIGGRCGRERRDDETATSYGASLLHDAGVDLGEVGRAVDRDRYGPAPLPDEERRRVEQVLSAAGEQRP